MDPLGATASVVGILASAVEGIGLLYATIEKIHDAPKAIQNIRNDLAALSPVLAQLDAALKSADPNIVAGDNVIPVLQNCRQACIEFTDALSDWTKHSPEDQMSRGDKWKIGLFRQHKIDALAAELVTCKDSLRTALLVAEYVQSTRLVQAVDLITPRMQKLEDSLQESVARVLGQQTAVHDLVQKLFTEDGETQEGASFIQELRQRQARNGTLNQESEKILQQTVQERNKQKIYNVKADSNSFNLAGRINAQGSDARTEQDVHDISATDYSFNATGVINNVDLAGLVAAMRQQK